MNRIQENQTETPTIASSESKIQQIESIIGELVGGNLELRFTNLSQYGEYAGICSNINDFVDKVETFFREAIGRMNDFAQGESDCQIDPRGFDNVFQETTKLFNQNLQHSDEQRKQQRIVSQTLQETVESLNETVSSMGDTANSLAQNATETLSSAESVGSNSTEANALTNEAATSCRELSTAINEIANSMQQANSVTFEAVELAEKTANIMDQLMRSSTEIGEIIELIDGISHQTNLLSLNASIEAARAGELGRGFAVVASEVKNLAFESRKNAKTISKQVVSIRQQTGDSVEAIKQINAVIDKINEISQTVAASTEEQGAATESISGIMQDVNSRAQRIALTIEKVSGGAKNNSEIAKEVTDRVNTLSEISRNLKELAVKLDT